MCVPIFRENRILEIHTKLYQKSLLQMLRIVAVTFTASMVLTLIRNYQTTPTANLLT